MRSKQSRGHLLDKLQNPEYRHEYVAAHIKDRLPEIIQNVREKAGISQKELGKRIGKHQTHISRIEHPNYGRFTINTLLEVFKALDIALYVTAIPFSAWLELTEDASASTLTPPPFDDAEEKRRLQEWAVGSSAPGPATSLKPPQSEKPAKPGRPIEELVRV